MADRSISDAGCDRSFRRRCCSERRRIAGRSTGRNRTRAESRSRPSAAQRTSNVGSGARITRGVSPGHRGSVNRQGIDPGLSSRYLIGTSTGTVVDNLHCPVFKAMHQISPRNRLGIGLVYRPARIVRPGRRGNRLIVRRGTGHQVIVALVRVLGDSQTGAGRRAPDPARRRSPPSVRRRLISATELRGAAAPVPPIWPPAPASEGDDLEVLSQLATNETDRRGCQSQPSATSERSISGGRTSLDRSHAGFRAFAGHHACPTVACLVRERSPP